MTAFSGMLLFKCMDQLGAVPDLQFGPHSASDK